MRWNDLLGGLAVGRSKQTCELTSSIVPRETPFHRLVDLESALAADMTGAETGDVVTVIDANSGQTRASALVTNHLRATV